MSTFLIRYRTHADRTAENQRLIQAVFAELHEHPLVGVHYTATCTPEGVFTHVVTYDDGVDDSLLTSLASFRRFQEGVRERCAEPPVRTPATLVGSFG